MCAQCLLKVWIEIVQEHLGGKDVLVTTYPLGSDTPIEYQLDKIYIIFSETYLMNIKYPHFRNILLLI